MTTKGKRIRILMHLAAIMVLSFLLLQMCWWGVNLLPSAGSLHTY